MPDLEPSIAEWRRQMLAAGIRSHAALEELEDHLRAEIERRIQSGSDRQPAFEAAAGQIGSAGILKSEFVKANVPLHEQLKQFILNLAKIPNLQPVTPMNTTGPNPESRRATYAKAAAFIFPAIFLWLFTMIFVLPKVNELCHRANMNVFNFENAPMPFRVLANTGSLLIFLSNHWFLTAGTAVLAFVLLERYFHGWSRYRRLAIGAGAFLLNGAVLVSLALIIISMVIAATALHQLH